MSIFKKEVEKIKVTDTITEETNNSIEHTLYEVRKMCDKQAETIVRMNYPDRSEWEDFNALIDSFSDHIFEKVKERM